MFIKYLLLQVFHCGNCPQIRPVVQMIVISLSQEDLVGEIPRLETVQYELKGRDKCSSVDGCTPLLICLS